MLNEENNEEIDAICKIYTKHRFAQTEANKFSCRQYNTVTMALRMNLITFCGACGDFFHVFEIYH